MIFSQKRDEPNHPLVYFNDSEVIVKHEQKHLGMIPDPSTNFHSHVRQKIIDALKRIRIIPYMSSYVTRNVLDRMYKLHVRLHLDYGDIIYHKHDPDLTLNFTKKLESTQYMAAPAVNRA